MKNAVISFAMLTLVAAAGALVPAAGYADDSCTRSKCPPSQWQTAHSNANFEGRLEYIDKRLYGELRDKTSGEIVLYIPCPDGNQFRMWDVSPDGSTIFYDYGDNAYAQNINGDQGKGSTAGRLRSIRFEGDWARLRIKVAGQPSSILWYNYKTGEVLTDQWGPSGATAGNATTADNATTTVEVD